MLKHEFTRPDNPNSSKKNKTKNICSENISDILVGKSFQHYTWTHAWVLIYGLLVVPDAQAYRTWESFFKICLGIHVSVMQ